MLYQSIHNPPWRVIGLYPTSPPPPSPWKFHFRLSISFKSPLPLRNFQWLSMGWVWIFPGITLFQVQDPNLQVVITHALHVCSQHSFGLPLRVNGCSENNLILRVWTFYHSLYDDARFNHLSLETYTKHSIRVKAFWLLIVVAHTP